MSIPSVTTKNEAKLDDSYVSVGSTPAGYSSKSTMSSAVQDDRLTYAPAPLEDETAGAPEDVVTEPLDPVNPPVIERAGTQAEEHQFVPVESPVVKSDHPTFFDKVKEHKWGIAIGLGAVSIGFLLNKLRK